MDGKRAHITDIRNMIEKLQRINEGASGLKPVPQFKTDKPTISAAQIMMAPFGRCAALQTQIICPLYS